MKKLASVLLILAMIFTMSATAFAANTNAHTITITNDKAGHTYTAYQVFKGDISNGKLTNIEWGSGVNGDGLLVALKALENSHYSKCNTAEAVADVLKGFKNDSQNLDEFARVVGGHLSDTAAGTSTIADGKYTINVTGDGYYFIKDTGVLGTDDAATKYILKVVGDVTVAAKPEVPSIDKVIVNADSGNGNGTAQDVGSVVKFQLTSKVPAMASYDTYTYIVNDTMSAGLTFNNDVAVTIGDTEYTDFTVAQNDQSFTITFNNFINQKAHAGKNIVIKYSATLNENALTTDKETNTVYLQYSNNPNSDTKGNTPEKVVYVYDFDLVIDKYTGDETTGERLSGAKFVLMNSDKTKYYYYDEANKNVQWNSLESGEKLEDVLAEEYTGNTKVTQVTTDANDAAKFQGLDSGTYYLHETEAPAGYNLLKEDVTVTITAKYGDDGQITESSAISTNNGQYLQTQKIENKSGTLLPSTGGIGTTIFYIAGAVLVIAAGVLLVTRRRMNKNK